MLSALMLLQSLKMGILSARMQSASMLRQYAACTTIININRIDEHNIGIGGQALLPWLKSRVSEPYIMKPTDILKKPVKGTYNKEEANKPLTDEMLERVTGGYSGGTWPILGDNHVYKNNICVFCGKRISSALAIDPICNSNNNIPDPDDDIQL